MASADQPRGWRLPAPALETAAARLLAHHFRRCAGRQVILAQPDAERAAGLQARCEELARELGAEAHRGGHLRQLIASGVLRPGVLRLQLCAAGVAEALGMAEALGRAAADVLAPDLLVLEAPLQMRRRGVEMRLVAGAAEPAPDAALLHMLARAHRWAAAVRGGSLISTLAQHDGVSESYVRSRLELAFLSPRLQAAIVAGTQPPELTLERLVRRGVPLDWSEQERRFGLTA